MIDEWSLIDVFEAQFEPTHLAASQTRQRLRTRLDEVGVERGLADDVELAASELLSNAVEQAPAEPVEVLVHLDGTALYLTVTNHHPAASVLAADAVRSVQTARPWPSPSRRARAVRLPTPPTRIPKSKQKATTMAYYTTTVRSPWSADEAFGYMADLRNLEEWDPGVRSSVLAVGTEPGEGVAYDVAVSGTELRYITKSYDSPNRTVVEASSTLLRSYDVIEVTPIADGCEVRYEATLELKGLLRLTDPLHGLFFNQIGDRAAAGMEKALDGSKVR